MKRKFDGFGFWAIFNVVIRSNLSSRMLHIPTFKETNSEAAVINLEYTCILNEPLSNSCQIRNEQFKIVGVEKHYLSDRSEFFQKRCPLFMLCIFHKMMPYSFSKPAYSIFIKNEISIIRVLFLIRDNRILKPALTSLL